MNVKQEKTAKKGNGKSYKKTLICIADIANKGKTSTALNVKDILDNYNGSTLVSNIKNSFIFKIKGQNIGVDIKGDPDTGFPTRINNLGSYPCDAIVCTSRSSGATIKAAKKTAANHSMLFIKTTTYQPDDTALENTMNNYKAEDIITMLKRRKHI